MDALLAASAAAKAAKETPLLLVPAPAANNHAAAADDAMSTATAETEVADETALAGGGGGAGMEVTDALEEDEAEAVMRAHRRPNIVRGSAPLTTLLTPPAIVRRRLLSYDRNLHLMPSVSAYAKQVKVGQLFLALSRFSSVHSYC